MFRDHSEISTVKPLLETLPSESISIIKSDPDASVSSLRQWKDSTDMAAKDMMNLINEMLTLSSLDEMNKTVKTERINLSAILQKNVLQMESVAYERGIII